MVNTTTNKPTGKPRKPYPDFPLFPHAAGVWAKKIRGKHHYFGPWDDPDGALQRYLDQRDDLYAGRTPRVTPDGLTVRDLFNRFLISKRHMVDTGEITRRTFLDYHATCRRVGVEVGLDRLVVDLASDDFEQLRHTLARTLGPVALGNEIRRTRIAFKYGHDAGLIDQPVRHGPTFKEPSRQVLRRARNSNGPRMFEADQIRSMVEAAGVQLGAMILLGVNCGFGNSDCATLPLGALDLDTGWIDYPRPKTGVQRTAPLWTETVEALQTVLEERPRPKCKADAELVFVTKYGQRWVKDTADNTVSKETAKLLKSLGIHRKGLGFYALRHTFETIGGDSKDQVAVDHIMGHSRDDMASIYRERISDERLRDVADHVHMWLFGW